MEVIATAGNDDVARVFIASNGDGKHFEFVESCQPPLTRDEKWVLMVSTLYGCPVGCSICDAGGSYSGKMSADEILEQVDFLVKRRYPDGVVPAKQFKIQFARMGEPAFNDAVLEVLEQLPQRYQAAGLMPSLSTVAPLGTEGFFERLMDIKRRLYSEGRFQLQFSIHTSDVGLRDQLIPVKKWGFEEIASYGERFVEEGERKITLNFALAQGMPVDEKVLLRHFDPSQFLIKMTPINPTYRSGDSGLRSHIDAAHEQERYEVIEALRGCGYQVLLSIGEVEENAIGSNCGQYVLRHLHGEGDLAGGYEYAVEGIG